VKVTVGLPDPDNNENTSCQKFTTHKLHR